MSKEWKAHSFWDLVKHKVESFNHKNEHKGQTHREGKTNRLCDRHKHKGRNFKIGHSYICMHHNNRSPQHRNQTKVTLFFFVQSDIKTKTGKKSNKEGSCMGKAPSASAPPLACPKNHHKKLDKKREKIDKNGTFILQYRW